jgi:hypothetical protein
VRANCACSVRVHWKLPYGLNSCGNVVDVILIELERAGSIINDVSTCGFLNATAYHAPVSGHVIALKNIVLVKLYPQN